MFSAQEITISLFYVRAAYQYFNSGFAKKDKARGAMYLLAFVQLIIIALDIGIISIDVAGYFKLKTFVHSFVYMVKLELEFVTLNQLVELSKLGSSGTLPWIPTAVDVSAADAPGASDREKRVPHVTVVRQQDSIASLEPCASKSSEGSIEFITKPQHLDWK